MNEGLVASLLRNRDKAEQATQSAKSLRQQYYATACALHAAGTSYREIAKILGISKGRAQQLCELGRRAIENV